MDTNSTISNDGLAPTRAQYISIHGSDSCYKQLKSDLKERTTRAFRAALWTTATRSYIESHVGEYIDEKIAESGTLFITDLDGHCVVTANTMQFEIAGRNAADGSLDVLIGVDVLKEALEAEPVLADVLAELALTGKVKVNVAARPAITQAYARYIIEFKPVDIRDMSWILNR